MSAEHSATNQARIEDVRWMAATGECATGAARRLGITVAALEKWCRRHAPEEWRRLVAREPHIGADRVEVGRRNAEKRWAS